MEDVKDQRQVFYEKEAQMWGVVAKWMNHFNQMGQLDDSFKNLLLNEQDLSAGFNIVYPAVKPVSTEQEHLQNLKARKDLGINTIKDLILMDRPNLTEEEINKVLEEIKAEKELKLNITDVNDETDDPEVIPDQLEDEEDEDK